jgi:heptosyltransferase-2
MIENRKILVIQPLPGIGDLFWFDAALQSLSAFYHTSLSLMTKQQSQAQHIYKDSPYVKEILWIEREGVHAGVGGFIRLVGELRRKKFSTVWIFHKSWRYLWACKLAGIQEIIHYPSNDQWLKKHPIDRVNMLLKTHKVPLLKEPKFLVSDPLKKRLKKKLSQHKKPWVAIGIGGTELSKKWACHHWEDLAVWLFQARKMSVFLLGGVREKEEASEMIAHIKKKGGEAVALTNFSLQESLAFLGEVDLFVGNDTGMMNGAAVLNRPTIGLFISSSPLSYRSSLRALQPLIDQENIILPQVQAAVDQIRASAK